MGIRFPVVVFSTLGFGCDGSGGHPPAALPQYFHLEGSASLESGTQTLDCHIDFIVELAGESARTDAFVEYLGTMGGDAGRQVLNPDGSGFALNGDAFSEVRARLTFPDQVFVEAINLPQGPTHNPPSFFEELTTFSGTLGPGDLLSGEWLCAPFFTDLGGFADDTLFADGVWFTETIN